MDIISKMKRQRPWVLLATAVSIAAVIVLARVSSPGEPMPLRLSLLYGALAMAMAATIIQIAYGQVIGMATELANSNTALQVEIAERKRIEEALRENEQRYAPSTRILSLVVNKIEEALRENEQRYRELFENAEDLIVTLTVDGVITDVNRGVEALLGRFRKEGIGRHFRDFLTPASNARMEERFRRFYAGEEAPPVFELELVRKDGSVVPVEVRARFIRDKEGNPIGIQTIHRDISARKALEQQRADFLVMLAHDIRNPLSVILGYTEMLHESAREQGDYWGENLLGRIESSALTVHSLVTNYLDLSKIEAGQLRLVKRSLAINDILSRVGRQYESESRRRHLTLEVHLQEELPFIEGDPAALERVFANLLHNGLKFTPEQGRVTITSAQRDGEVMAAFSDTGPGMTAAEIPVLFEKYRQAERPRQQQGTGLGLFIVKTLVEAHGGRIEVESTPGVRTCFSVFLPVTAPAEQREG